MNEPLESLIARCRTNDGDAVRELVRRYRASALGLAKALLHDPSKAEDVVQEAFMAALARLDGLREPTAFWGWFRQIVRTCANRAQRRRCEEPLSETQAASLGHDIPRSSIEREDLCELVRTAIEELPDGARETVRLFYLEERSCAEAAELLHIPVGTVKRRLYDARKRLRGLLLGALCDD